MRIINFGIFLRISRNFDHSAITSWYLKTAPLLSTVSSNNNSNPFNNVIDLSSPRSTNDRIALISPNTSKEYLGPVIFCDVSEVGVSSEVLCAVKKRKWGSHEQTCRELIVLDRELNFYHRGKITEGYVSIIQKNKCKNWDWEIQNSANSL
jgi:hypothetical protein